MKKCINRGSADQSGFTMIELLVVVGIVAILLAMAAPSMTSSINRSRLKDMSNELSGSLQMARAEAKRRGSADRVAVVPNVKGAWESGWAVFVDSSNSCNSGVAPAPESGVVIHRVEAQPNNAKIQAAGLPDGCVSYTSDGSARPAIASSGYLKSVFELDISKGDLKGRWHKSCVIVSPPGDVRIVELKGPITNASDAVCPSS